MSSKVFQQLLQQLLQSDRIIRVPGGLVPWSL